MENLDKLQQEWAIINASRELLSLVKKNPFVTYKDALKFAKEIDPTIHNTSIGSQRKNRTEKLYEKFAQEAFALSRERNSHITPEVLIESRLSEIEKYLNFYTKDDKDPEDLRKEAADLITLLKRKSSEFLSLKRITENQAILNDAFGKRAGKVWLENNLGRFNTYIDKENQGIFRVSVLHPNKSEVITGADLIYEQYDSLKEKVRIVVIQYKIWENGTLYFSQAGNLNAQLKKMASCFCGGHFCKNNLGDNISPTEYRLPYCCAFLKPTDKLQNPNKLTTSGYHIPVCKVDDAKKFGRNNFILYLDNILAKSVKSQTFEELFNSNILGSRWLDKSELEELYRRTDILEPNEKIMLYAQNIV